MRRAARARAVVVSAGRGGRWLAREPGGQPVEVLVLVRTNYHAFCPLLYLMGAAEIEASEVAYPVRLRPQQARQSEIPDGGGRGARRGAPGGVRSRPGCPYDMLVLALGSEPHFLGIPGAAEHSFPLKALDHGLELRNQILSRFELAATDPRRHASRQHRWHSKDRRIGRRHE